MATSKPGSISSAGTAAPQAGLDAASGTYFYRLKINADGPQLTRSMTLVR